MKYQRIITLIFKEVEKIIDTTKQLQEFNPVALQQITEYALKKKYIDEAWKFIEALEIKRPHYFWPLLKYAGNENGELGSYLQKIK